MNGDPVSDDLARAFRDSFDVVMTDKEAIEYLHCGRDFFQKHYARLGIKQGRYRVYRRSDLLERLEQLRGEANV